MYAHVIVDNPGYKTDKPFHYKVPRLLLEDVKVGTRVAVSFGVSNRVLEGYVVGISTDCPVDQEKIKEVIDIIDQVPLFSEELIGLGKWMKEKYLSTWVDSLQCIMPSHIKKRGKRYLILTEGTNRKCENESHQEVLTAIREEGGKVEYNRLKKLTGLKRIHNILKEMIRRGIIVEDYVLDAPVNPKYLLFAKLMSKKENWRLPKNAKRQKTVLSYLENVEKEVACSQVIKETGSDMSVLHALEKKGVVEICKKRIVRMPGIQTGLVEDRVAKLTSQQINAIQKIHQMREMGTREILIHGVTGSGKTEIYMRLIKETIKRGKKAIVLVPEISLTPQMVEWYHRRFNERAALFHSKLSPGERFDQWEGIRKGNYDVAIGARSAVFAPFENIGLIIIDEEHEHTYKSETSPRYHTRDVARQRCKYYDGLIVLGSATPSVETYYRAVTGEIGLVELDERVESRSLPKVKIVDMREELKAGNRSVFSRSLKEEISSTLERNEQIMLLLNRRGYSTYVSCRDCGKVLKCPNCDISLTYHRQENWLICHYCGYREKVPRYCNNCKSGNIKYIGTGTQKLENEVLRMFPDVRILRMDVDSTRKKGEHYKIIKAFKDREADILLGTQMIAKGLDFPGVTLVGVILADFSLNIPDFRSAERTFQLLTQVSGRAGRGDKKGKVIIQTYSPDHYSIITAKNHYYTPFYQNEIKIREQFGYIPFTQLINIIVTGENDKDAADACNNFYILLMKSIKAAGVKGFEVYGPSPALHSKIKGRYRWQIIIKANNMDIIKEEIKKIRLKVMRKLSKGVNIVVDVDPYNLI